MSKLHSKHKIFVSYAHIDNQPIANQQWVSEFFENLNNNIGVELGRREYYDIWFDKTSLHGNGQLTDNIKSKVRDADIFVMILSTGYINSSWCMEELKTFLEHNSDNTLSNIFIIHKENLEIEKKPKAIRDILGFNFWFMDENAKCRIYRSNHPIKEKQSKYHDLIEDVSSLIGKYLEKGKNSLITAKKEKIYLAEVSDDLDTTWNEVKRYLEDYGYDVYPKKYLPLEADAFKIAVREMVEKCDLFVQLLSAVKGRTPSDLAEGYRESQFNIAKESNRPILQWHNPKLVVANIEDSGHKALLSTEFIQINPLENFKKTIVNKIVQIVDKRKKELDKENKKRDKASYTQASLVFVNNSREDEVLAKELSIHLKNRFDVIYMTYSELTQSKEIRESVENYILECDCCVVLYGESPISWVKTQYLQYRRHQKIKQDNSFFIYKAPPPKDGDIGIESFNIKIKYIDGSKKCDFEQLEDMIQKELP